MKKKIVKKAGHAENEHQSNISKSDSDPSDFDFSDSERVISQVIALQKHIFAEMEPDDEFNEGDAADYKDYLMSYPGCRQTGSIEALSASSTAYRKREVSQSRDKGTLLFIR